jgi:hypothetical protein
LKAAGGFGPVFSQACSRRRRHTSVLAVPDRQRLMATLGGQGSSSGRVMEKELRDGKEEKAKGDLASMMVSQKNQRAVDGTRGRGGRSAALCARWQVVTEP